MFYLYFVIGLIFCALFGLFYSIESVWDYHFAVIQEYLKAGEYGEAEGYKYPWSLWKEPLNAWTSLAYSLFGFVTFFTGLADYFYKPQEPLNDIANNPSFTILYGISCIYLGCASFLFHASHSEIWRKADAGMTSGVAVVPFVFAIWDRARPTSTNAILMSGLALLFQFSLTHGYLPYGSSDTLLPSLIASMWLLELSPRYGGAVSGNQYMYWMECFYGIIGGVLLRASDIKRKNKQQFHNLLIAFFILSIFPFGFVMGITNIYLWFGLISGTITLFRPEKGHVFWHIFSAFALFNWWLMLRMRQGDPTPPEINITTGVYSIDIELIAVIFFIIMKNSIRRLFMTITSVSEKMKLKIRLFLEHLFFAVLGIQIFLIVPLGADHGNNINNNTNNFTDSSSSSSSSSSWLINTINCWQNPIYPSSSSATTTATTLYPAYTIFHLYYQMKVAAYVEELLYVLMTNPSSIFCTLSSSSSSISANNPSTITNNNNNNNNNSNISINTLSTTTPSSTLDHSREFHHHHHHHHQLIQKQQYVNIHHAVSGVLAIISYITGYAKIGSLVMFFNDMSEVPLDIMRLFTSLTTTTASNKNVSNNSKSCSHIITVISAVVVLGSWLYWRLYMFFTKVIFSIAFESKSRVFDTLSTSPSSSASASVLCEPGHCTWLSVPERVPFLFLLLILFGFQCIWFQELFIKLMIELKIINRSATSVVGGITMRSSGKQGGSDLNLHNNDNTVHNSSINNAEEREHLINNI